MARSVMEVAFLGTQRFDGENGQKYIKIWYGEEADGKTEHGLAVIQMAAADEVAEEVFAAGKNFEPLEAVRITFDIARGGQNKGKNLALHIEAANPRGKTTGQPGQAAPNVKPEQAKA